MLLWQWLRILIGLILSWRSPLSYRNQSTDLLCKSMDWFLYDNGLRHERVHQVHSTFALKLWQFHWNCKNYQKNHALTVIKTLRCCAQQGLKRISFLFKVFNVLMKKCVVLYKMYETEHEVKRNWEWMHYQGNMVVVT